MSAPGTAIVISDDEGHRALLGLDVLAWRYDELGRSGYPTDVAAALAAMSHVDLHVACDLLHNGATVHEALRILT